MFNTDYLDNIFYIYPAEKDAQEGKNTGACGFYVGVTSNYGSNSCYVYGVTNAHVLEAIEADAVYIRLNKKSGGIKVISIPQVEWHKHPAGDDLAIYLYEPDPEIDFRVFFEENFLAKEDLEKHSIGVGDHTRTVGRYIMHSGKKYNTPVVRFGRISMIPGETIRQPNRKFDQESFLVETYSVNGFSGSPVYLWVDADGREAPEQLTEARTFLLGVDWGHFDFDGTVRVDPFSHKISAPSGMMCVVPSWKLKDLLYDEIIIKQRNEFEKNIDSLKN